MAMFYPPHRALWVWLRGKLRQRRCAHINWTPLDGGCPDCGRP